MWGTSGGCISSQRSAPGRHPKASARTQMSKRGYLALREQAGDRRRHGRAHSRAAHGGGRRAQSRRLAQGAHQRGLVTVFDYTLGATSEYQADPHWQRGEGPFGLDAEEVFARGLALIVAGLKAQHAGGSLSRRALRLRASRAARRG